MSLGRRKDEPFERGATGSGHGDLREDLLRLEEIADLHFAASAHATALDYLRRILTTPGAVELDLEHRLRLHRKCIDAALNIGDLSAAERYLQRAHDLLAGDTDVTDDLLPLRATLQGREAVLLTQRGAYVDALHLCKSAFAVLAVTDNHLDVANLQATMGVCHHRLGRLDKAEEFYADALATYRRIGDELGVASQYSNLALLKKNACRWDEAIVALQRAIAIADRHGASHLLSRLLLNIGIVHLKRGAADEGRIALERSLSLARGLGDRDRETKIDLALGYLELHEGNLLRAEELILAGKNLADHHGFWRESVIADEYLGDLLLARGEGAAALVNYELGLEKIHGQRRVSDLEGELLRRVAAAHLALDAPARAVAAAEAAIAACTACGERYELGFAHDLLGRALIRQGRIEDGVAAFHKALSHFADQQLWQCQAECLVHFVPLLVGRSRQQELRFLRRRLEHLLDAGDTLRQDRLRLDLLHARALVLLELQEWEEALLACDELQRCLESAPDENLAAACARLRRQLEERLTEPLVLASGRGQHSLIDLAHLLGGEGELENLSIPLTMALERLGGGKGCLLRPLPGGEWVVAASSGLEREEALALRECLETAHPGLLQTPLLVQRENLLSCHPEAAGNRKGLVVSIPLNNDGSNHGLLLLLPEREMGASLAPALEHLGSVAAMLSRHLAERASGSAIPPIRTDDGGAFGAQVGFITRNRRMLELLDLTRKVAPSELTVLLQGETGTGKGLLARAIHLNSPRREARFLAINCAAIPETLLESELFGHVRGSFTGALTDKKGLIVEAEGGTVFLDEIGKLPLSMQGKLLQFLDTKIVRPVGSNRSQRVDVRIICATKSLLREKVEQGVFLEDLYYRLTDFPLVIPPLRRRRDDLPLLVRHFLARHGLRTGTRPPGVSRSFLAALESYDWPGNVRELEKVLARAIVLSQGAAMLTPDLLPFVVPEAPSDGGDDRILPLRESLYQVERREIARALEMTGGNKAAAARLLGISYPSLLKKVRQYGLAASA